MKRDNSLYKKTALADQFLKEDNYWMNKLAGEISKSFFPYDYKPYDIKTGTHNKEEFKFKFTGELFSRLMKLRNGSDSRLHMILITGIIILLHRVTGSNDIIIGTPTLKQKSHMKFINTVLVLRNLIEDNMSFKQLLLSVRQTLIEATENQNYPVETLPHRLNIPFPEGDDFPLFDVALLIENIHDRKYIEHIDVNMIFSFLRKEDCIQGNIEFSSSLYNRAAIERIADYYKQIYRVVFADIDIEVSAIDILPEQERHQLLNRFNDTDQFYPQNKTLHQLFAEQAARTPEKTAVVGKAHGVQRAAITYRELNEKADQLAHFLKEKGTGPDTITAIMMEHSLEMVIGLLGILKSGSAYLPIDPGYPRERIDYMLKDSNAALLLTERELSDAFKNKAYRAPGILPATANLHLLLAYVIYTSGTTGRPKGTAIEHKSVVNTLVSRANQYNFSEKDVHLQLFSLSFDGFVTSFFTPLVSGSRVVLLTRDEIIDSKRIITMIVSHQATHLLCVPILFQSILEAASGEEMESLKVITLAGDKLQSNIIEMAREKCNHIEIAHEYGVTEAAVMSTIYRHQENNPTITIGKPTANTKIYIQDKNHNLLQPVGIPGELSIGGPGLARGYLNNPELTAEKFLSISNRSYRSYRSYSLYFSKKIYKTGDLARWLPEGNIEFLGRIDHQVKIRGYRIELAEIENRLLNHAGIKKAVVIDRQDRGGQKYLCAYITADEELGGANTSIILKEYLSRHLPAYMVPPYVVKLEQLPLTPNGKVDKEALPEPKITVEDDYIAPGDEIEEKLVDIWADVLNVDKEIVGINANFFDFGGQSFKAAILTAKIEKEFKVMVPLVELFKTPTISALSRFIKEARTDTPPIDDLSLVLLKGSPGKAHHIFFIHDGAGEVDCYIELCRNLNSGFNCWGIRPEPLVNLMPANITFEKIAGQYIEKIKKVQEKGPYYIAGWSMGGIIAYEMAGQLQSMNEPIALLAMIDSYTFRGNPAGEVRGFTIETELEFLREFFENDHDIRIALGFEPGDESFWEAVEFEEVWRRIAHYFESPENSGKQIDKIINGYNVRSMVPNIDQLGIKEKICYINLLRSLNNAAMAYTPANSINSNSLVHFIKARDTAANRLQVSWNEYMDSPQLIKTSLLAGDHFSILAAPEVVELANELDRALKIEDINPPDQASTFKKARSKK